jgi:CheY-like chemotaxis protein
MWQLSLRNLVTQGQQAADPITITRFPSLVGRHSECECRINSPFISRRQCSFFEKEGQVWVADLGSRNGTELNGEPIHDERALKEGDILNLAGSPFEVHLTALGAEGDRMPVQAETPQCVLVVEDDKDAAETLALLLKRWGHEVHVAHNGPEAIQVAQTHQPDAVLMDLRLPGMDGYEVAERLRQQPGVEPALMVAMTGHEGEQDRQGAAGGEFDQVLIKPVDPKVLQEVFSR